MHIYFRAELLHNFLRLVRGRPEFFCKADNILLIRKYALMLGGGRKKFMLKAALPTHTHTHTHTE